MAIKYLNISAHNLSKDLKLLDSSCHDDILLDQ